MLPKDSPSKDDFLPELYHFVRLGQYLQPLFTLYIVEYLSLFLIQTVYLGKLYREGLFLKCLSFYAANIYFAFVFTIYRRLLKAMEIDLKTNPELFWVTSNMFHVKVAKTAQKLLKKTQINFRLLMVMSITVMFLITRFWFSNRDTIAIFWVLNEQFNYSESFVLQVLNWVMSVSNMMALVPIASSPLYFIFVLFHIQLEQLRLCGYVYKLKDECNLVRQVQKRNCNSGIEALSNNAEFQCFVSSQLKLITIKSIETKRYIKYFNSKQTLYFMYILNGSITMAIYASFIFFSQAPSYIGIAGLIVYIHCIYFTCECCEDLQRFANLTSEAINNLTWYDWNRNCQEMYKTILIDSCRDREFTILSFMSVNRELFKKMSQLTYTVLNFFYSTM